MDHEACPDAEYFDIPLVIELNKSDKSIVCTPCKFVDAFLQGLFHARLFFGMCSRGKVETMYLHWISKDHSAMMSDPTAADPSRRWPRAVQWR